MNTPQEAMLEISYPKALLVTLPSMACFVAFPFVNGKPTSDPLFNGSLLVMAVFMTFVFAGCLCFVLRCKIGCDGLRSAVPTFYQYVLRWEDIAVVRGFVTPFYVVKSSAFGPMCICHAGFSSSDQTASERLLTSMHRQRTFFARSW